VRYFCQTILAWFFEIFNKVWFGNYPQYDVKLPTGFLKKTNFKSLLIVQICRHITYICSMLAKHISTVLEFRFQKVIMQCDVTMRIIDNLHVRLIFDLGKKSKFPRLIKIAKFGYGKYIACEVCIFLYYVRKLLPFLSRKW
jgi:hypothetical protein